MATKHGEHCFRCGARCEMSTLIEVPEDQTEPVRYEIFKCASHGVQAKREISKPEQPSPSELDLAHNRLAAALEEATDGPGSDHSWPFDRSPHWPSEAQQKALREQHETTT